MVTRGYKGFQWVTGGYKGLQGVTRGYRVLQGVRTLFLDLFLINTKDEKTSTF